MLIALVLCCTGDEGGSNKLTRGTDVQAPEPEIGVGVGYATVCLGSDAIVEGAEPPKATDTSAGPRTWQVAGELLADGLLEGLTFDLDPCSGWEPHRGYRVLDDTGVTWWVGYATADADQQGSTPIGALPIGSRVVFDYAEGEGSDGAAAVLRTTEGQLLHAVDTGKWLERLGHDVLAGLSVEAGDAYGGWNLREECRRRGVLLRLAGESVIELEGGDTGTLELGGEPLHALAIDTWAYDEDNDNTEACDATREERSFIAWRE